MHARKGGVAMNTNGARVHPEVRERFHELLRFHMAHYRRDKDPWEVRRDMRDADMREQAALLRGPCEMELVLAHSPACASRRMVGLWGGMPCDCEPVQSLAFRAVEPEAKGMDRMKAAMDAMDAMDALDALDAHGASMIKWSPDFKKEYLGMFDTPMLPPLKKAKGAKRKRGRK